MFPDGTDFYLDVQDGVSGFNTDPARGADTFVPFLSKIKILASKFGGSGELTYSYTAQKKCRIVGYLNSSGPGSGVTQASINNQFFCNDSWGSSAGGGIYKSFIKELNAGDTFYARVYTNSVGYASNVTIFVAAIGCDE